MKSLVKTRLLAFVAAPLFLAPIAGAAALEDGLRSLELGETAPVAISQEKLYSVQSRPLPLTRQSELSIGGGTNVTGDSFLNTRSLDFGYRFHFSDRWAVVLAHTLMQNKLSPAATRLRDANGMLPDVPFAKTATDLSVEMNLFYGKFRLNSARVYYFDQYVALGVGAVALDRDSATSIVGDVGLAAWLGRWSARVGLKDYFYSARYSTGPVAAHNLFPHVGVGVVF